MEFFKKKRVLIWLDVAAAHTFFFFLHLCSASADAILHYYSMPYLDYEVSSHAKIHNIYVNALIFYISPFFFLNMCLEMQLICVCGCVKDAALECCFVQHIWHVSPFFASRAHRPSLSFNFSHSSCYRFTLLFHSSQVQYLSSAVDLSSTAEQGTVWVSEPHLLYTGTLCRFIAGQWIGFHHHFGWLSFRSDSGPCLNKSMLVLFGVHFNIACDNQLKQEDILFLWQAFCWV